jgi:hypothetical protein
MSPRPLLVAFVALTGLLASRAAAQDALGGALVDDEWEAILKLAPPPASVATSETPEKKGREERASTRSSREASASRERGANGSSGDSKEADKPSGEARGSTREQNKSEKESDRSRKESEKTSSAEGTKRAAREERASKDSVGRAKKSAKIELATEVITASRGAKSEGRDKGEARGSAREQSDDKNAAASTAQPTSVETFRGSGIATYDDLVRAWHDPWPAHASDHAADLLAGAPPVLSLHPVGKQSTPYILLPNGRDGGFNEAQLAVASQAFGSWPGGPQISPRLLDLIYHAAQHFKVFHVHLISGVRNDRSGSRHSHGLAADVVFPGVSNEELAHYFRPQGFLGVGIYTRAGFVHVDVREKSFFWLDKSPPGRRTKVVPIRAEEARLADEAAVARGQVGYVNPPRLQKALIARARRRREKVSTSQ